MFGQHRRTKGSQVQLMRRRDVVALVGGAVLAGAPRLARAQTRPFPVIGFLQPSSARAVTQQLAAFQQGLKETGFVEHQSVVVEYRFAEGRYERLPEFAEEFVRNKVDVIVATGSTLATTAAMNATSTIPIVFVVGRDPQKIGLIPSLNRPGGNATGATVYSLALDGKRVQLLRDLVPLARGDTVAKLTNGMTGSSEIEVDELARALKDAGLQLRILDASTDRELEAAFAEAGRIAKAMVVTADQFFFGSHRKLIVELAARYKVPAIYSLRDYVEAGGLISYGVRFTESYRVAGTYVGRILKGAKPGDLPVQNPTVFDLTINRKALAGLGLTLPRIMMVQANEIFDE
jgi:putative ABC transport system substrate-binding protein